jgi:hypothetical protein
LHVGVNGVAAARRGETAIASDCSLRGVPLQPSSLRRCYLAPLGEPNKVTGGAGVTVPAEDAANTDKLKKKKKKKKKKKSKKANDELRSMLPHYSNVCSHHAFESYHSCPSSTNSMFLTRSCFSKPADEGVKLIASHGVKWFERIAIYSHIAMCEGAATG